MKSTLQKLYNWWMVLAIVAIFAALYSSILYPWMNRWGVSDAEMTMSLTGDNAVSGVVITSTRGVTIHAPASEVWKWVVQLGQERAGFYSNDWLENLVLSDIHNANEIRDEWQKHQLGDKVFGAGGAVYKESATWTIQTYEEGKATYLWGAIVVIPVDEQTSRLLVRTYAPPASPAMQPINAYTYDWMHFVMERGMLLGIKARAEHTLESDALLGTFSTLGWMFMTLLVGFTLFVRKSGWWWGLIPLAYAGSILVFTHDVWSAAAGFLWWGIIAAGFIQWGRSWWKGLSLCVVAVITIFVLASQPHAAFGIIFLAFVLVVSVLQLLARNGIAKTQLFHFSKQF